MLQFEESIKKRAEKANEKKPAWQDDADSKIKVDIESVSRLRKLKKTEEEKEVQGTDYTQRLQDHYQKQLTQSNTHQLFQWAESNADQNNKQTEDDSGSEEDPIGNLLKSNKAVFGKRNEVL